MFAMFTMSSKLEVLTELKEGKSRLWMSGFEMDNEEKLGTPHNL